MIKTYPYAVEIEKYQFDVIYPQFLLWAEEHFTRYPVDQEDCMGQNFTIERFLYAIVHKNFNDPDAGVFFFLRSGMEYDAFIQKFGSQILDTNPFTISF